MGFKARASTNWHPSVAARLAHSPDHIEALDSLCWTLEEQALELQDRNVLSEQAAPLTRLLKSESGSQKQSKALSYAHYLSGMRTLDQAKSKADLSKAHKHGVRSHALGADTKCQQRIEERISAAGALLKGRAGDKAAFGELAELVSEYDTPHIGVEVADSAFVAYLRSVKLPQDVDAIGDLDRYHERAALVQVLLARGAEPDVENVEAAIRQGDCSTVRLLTESKKFKPDRDDKESILQEACEEGRSDIVSYLLERKYKAGPVHLRAASTADVVRLLVHHGVNPNKERSGYSPVLHHQAEYGTLEVVQALIECGAKRDRKASGVTALELARKAGRFEIADFLSGGEVPSGMDLEPMYTALNKLSSHLATHSLGSKQLPEQLLHLLDIAKGMGISDLTPLAELVHSQGCPHTSWAMAQLAQEAYNAEKVTTKLPKGAAFILGDVRILGNLSLSAPVLIAGSLEVNGVIIDSGDDSLLGVATSVKAKSIISDGAFWVGEDIHVSDLLLGHYNHQTLAAGGHVKARLLLLDDHDFQGHATAEYRLDLDNAPTSAETKKITQYLGTWAIDKSEGCLDVGEICKRSKNA